MRKWKLSLIHTMSSPSLPNDTPNRTNGRNETPTTSPPEPLVDTATPAPENPDNMDVDEEEEDDQASISLPMSKIKRIFKMDPEYFGASQAAVFATGAATELFIQYITEQAALLAKMEKRKKIMYKDFSAVVSTQDSLNFLSDTIPKTIPLREVFRSQQTGGTEEGAIEGDTTVEQTATVESAAAPSRRIDIMSMLPTLSEPSASPAAPEVVKKANINNLVSNDSD